MPHTSPAEQLRTAAVRIRADHGDTFHLAVADWLDHEAIRLTNLTRQWSDEWDNDARVIAALTDGMFRHPLAIARAYLGVDTQVPS